MPHADYHHDQLGIGNLVNNSIIAHSHAIGSLADQLLESRWARIDRKRVDRSLNSKTINFRAL